MHKVRGCGFETETSFTAELKLSGAGGPKAKESPQTGLKGGGDTSPKTVGEGLPSFVQPTITIS